jgi:hypothetical protein
MTQSYDDVVRNLTAPGAPFEIVTETVRGRAMKTFKNASARCATRSPRRRRAATSTSWCRATGASRTALSPARSGAPRARSPAITASPRATRGDPLLQLPGLDHRAIRRHVGGWIGVGLNGWWATEELEYGLVDSGSRFLVVDERLFPRVEPLLGRSAGSRRSSTSATSAARHGADRRADRAARRAADVAIDEDDPFVILYTSGTTGRSKGCITTHRGTIAQVTGILFANLVNAALSGGSLLPPSGTSRHRCSRRRCSTSADCTRSCARR